jgi:hypothetical protein
MNPAGPDPLAGLRAYRLPEAVSWWPPAPGWWLLTTLVLLLAAAAAWWWLRKRRCQARYRAAMAEVTSIRARYAVDGDATMLVRDLSKLLRRYALAMHPRRDVAALTGEDWLRFLDANGGGREFVDGVGRQLIDAPYRPVGDIAAEPLIDLVAAWLRSHREVCR